MPTLTEAYIELMLRLEQILGYGSTLEILVSDKQFTRIAWERENDRRTLIEYEGPEVTEVRLSNGTSFLEIKRRKAGL
jgi:hypothetical protein